MVLFALIASRSAPLLMPMNPAKAQDQPRLKRPFSRRRAISSPLVFGVKSKRHCGE
jgi:hypothetical protein